MLFKKLFGRIAYKLFFKEAKKYMNEPNKTKFLLSRSERKALNHKLTLGNVWRKLSLLIQWLKSWVTGEYRNVPYKIIIMLIVGLIYFVSSIDIHSRFFLELAILMTQP
ncbi:methyltransferase type 11 [Bacillus sp. FJAT-49736]|uniref:methyltransferase type 11 n=1 Tax=Bacillus sp. FJAT-49736 TaxID=2833582 RepID=UPI001BC976F7|nr:methyltransferase type 11 [Bacillus sp. FJAT-49736]MBS4172300.1 methyltransferase type 11 [Bacillus sp. FJAT-49736]